MLCRRNVEHLRSTWKGDNMDRRTVATMAALFALTGIVTAPAWASLAAQGHPGKGPPPEAYEACKDKSEGTAVEMTTPRGDTIKATCKQINGQLVAVPEGGPQGSGNGKPPKGGGNEQ
jgi:hypothetical protein